MKHNKFDKEMRAYEIAHDHCVLPNIYIVARLDGRNFTKYTLEYDKPFDNLFNTSMVATANHLMECGFNIIYAYTESDEISLLFNFKENLFSRKLRKLNSILAGEASAFFSRYKEKHGVFDCRICQLPTKNLVIDYFRWRQEDASRNCLNAYCYWTLRKHNFDSKKATNYLKGKSTSEKNEILYRYGINFNNVDCWKKRGVGCYWKNFQREGFNPIEKQKVIVKKRKIQNDIELPMKQEYDYFLKKLLEENENEI